MKKQSETVHKICLKMSGTLQNCLHLQEAYRESANRPLSVFTGWSSRKQRDSATRENQMSRTRDEVRPALLLHTGDALRSLLT